MSGIEIVHELVVVVDTKNLLLNSVDPGMVIDIPIMRKCIHYNRLTLCAELYALNS